MTAYVWTMSAGNVGDQVFCLTYEDQEHTGYLRL